MRLLPSPCDGLHPAYPKMPEPLPCSLFVASWQYAAISGLVGAGAGKVFRNRPGFGLTVAAYTGLGLGMTALLGDYVKEKQGRAYLATKNIKVPERKFVERIGNIDLDNYTLVGGGVGVLVAALGRKPWTVTGFSRFLGSFYFGASGGMVAGMVALSPIKAKEQVARQRAIAARFDDEKKSLQLSTFGKGREQPQTSAVAAQVGMSSIQQLLQQGTGSHQSVSHLQQGLPQAGPHAQGFSTSHVNREDAHELDVSDPRPHLSESWDGERVFRPETNYKWTPGSEGPKVLVDHINDLKKRRKRLAQEAELVWYEIAVREGKYYETPNDVDAKTERRIGLEIMNEIHLNIWLEIGIVDWMIADSKKNLLQAEAWKTKTQWYPAPPPESEATKPTHTLRLLAELDMINKEHLGVVGDTAHLLQQESPDPQAQNMIDPRTGLPPTDAKELLQYMSGLVEKAQREEELKAKAIEEITKEAEQQMESANR